jgi:hypothetical protein
MTNEKMIELEKQLENKLVEESQDKVTIRNKWQPRKLNSLSKQASKKPEYILVQYLMNSYMMDFQLCKVISGNIIVINNKGHRINPRSSYRHGKYLWYIVRECDTEPVNNNDAPLLKKYQRSTENHPILIKMVLGAIKKNEEKRDNKNMITIIVVLAVVGIILYMIFGKK